MFLSMECILIITGFDWYKVSETVIHTSMFSEVIYTCARHFK